ncbi:LysR family transcriptional regulator [Sulfitobacter geojensis]|uniref:LysR family transcriptional regulator n=1 Tax=Sulfitobacter geojensis TaxID=1342299 RepID=UPI000469B81B|nr:LysR family transcriptional regulator [Sulfitobacter geojensis]KHA54044.1 Transcriptional regulator, LysR family [Sulfitobacter geojensis]NYI29861.1 LysR family nitrogen assimilation transcriptional regulator [Sulfitobacter geojensis]
MDIRSLRYFLAIADSPSLSVASTVLGVAQPSLSQNVHKMEEELGVKLLSRSPRGIKLTEEGQVLEAHAKQICLGLETCIKDIQELGTNVRGTVAFGMPPSSSMVLSVPLVETIQLEYPEIRLKVIEAISGYFKPWLVDGTVELALIYDLKDVEKFPGTHVIDEELFFYSAPDAWPFDSSPDQPISFRELGKVDMILPTNGLRDTIRRYEEEQNAPLNVIIEMDAMRQIIELVTRGSGYAIFAPSATQKQVERGELLQTRIVDPVLTRSVHLVRHPDHVPSRACRTVEDITLYIMRELIQRGLWLGQVV